MGGGGGIRNVVAIPFAVDLDVANAAAAYMAGDQIGAVMEVLAPAPFLSGPQGQVLILQTMTGNDADNVKAAVDVLFFRVAPVDVGDGNAFAPTAAEIASFIGLVSVAAADWAVYGSVAAVVKAGLLEAMRVVGGKFWAVVVSTGAPTYATANILKIKLAGVQT